MKVNIPIEAVINIFPAAYDLKNMPRKKKKKMKKEFAKVFNREFEHWLENNKENYERI